MTWAKTDRLRIWQHRIRNELGEARVFIAMDSPVMVTATALMYPPNRGSENWVLSHIEVTEEDRRKGYGYELLRLLNQTFGPLGALWCSESGKALAHYFEHRHGPQPWRTEDYNEDELRRILDVVLAKETS